MDSLKLLDFSSFIIFSDDPWSLFVSFCQLFKLPLVVKCCDVICEWPLILKIFVNTVIRSSISLKVSMSQLIEELEFPLTLIDLAEGRDSYIMMADPPRRNTGNW